MRRRASSLALGIRNRHAKKDYSFEVEEIQKPSSLVQYFRQQHSFRKSSNDLKKEISTPVEKDEAVPSFPSEPDETHIEEQNEDAPYEDGSDYEFAEDERQKLRILLKKLKKEREMLNKELNRHEKGKTLYEKRLESYMENPAVTHEVMKAVLLLTHHVEKHFKESKVGASWTKYLESHPIPHEEYWGHVHILEDGPHETKLRNLIDNFNSIVGGHERKLTGAATALEREKELARKREIERRREMEARFNRSGVAMSDY